MLKIIFALLTLIVGCYGYQDNLIWYRIPKYYVSDSVNNFLKNHQINNCFYKLEDEDTLLLKCMRNNKLVDVEISIQNKVKSRSWFESLSI